MLSPIYDAVVFSGGLQNHAAVKQHTCLSFVFELWKEITLPTNVACYCLGLSFISRFEKGLFIK